MSQIKFESRLRSPWWEQTAVVKNRIVTFPPLLHDTEYQHDFRDFGYLALRHHGSFTAGYAARVSPTRIIEAREKLETELRSGPVDPTAMYIIQSAELNSLWPSMSDRFRCSLLDGFCVCGPRGAPGRPPGAPVIGRATFQKFLAEYKDAVLILAVKDDAIHRLSDEARVALRQIGASVDELEFRGSYAGLFKGGVAVWDEVNNGGEISKNFEAGTRLDGLEFTRAIRIRSAGKQFGNLARVEVGRTFGGGRGFLALALSDAMEPIAWGQFDTHAGDGGYLFDHAPHPGSLSK